MQNSIVDRLLRAYDEWLSDSQSELSADLLRALDRMVEDFAGGEPIAPALRTAVRHLGCEWESASRTVNPGDQAAAMPHTVWRALDALEDAHAEWVRSQVPELESIADLVQQRVPDRQICRIYGFIRPDGIEDLDRLAEEIANPGCHTGNGWMAPAHRKRLETAQGAVSAAGQRRERRDQLASGRASASLADLPDLIEQGVSARQIAKMLALSIDEVLERCRADGLPEPAIEYRSIQSQRGAFEPEMLEAASRTLEAEIARPTRPSTQRVAEERQAKPQALQNQFLGGSVTGRLVETVESVDRVESGQSGQLQPEPQPQPQPTPKRPAAAHLLADVVKLFADGLAPGQIARTLRKQGHSITAAEVREVVAKS